MTGKLRCSEQTRRPSTATVSAVAEALANGDFYPDEFSRVEEIKGQRSANVLTAAKPRRKLVGRALAGLTPGEWSSIDALFRLPGHGLGVTLTRAHRGSA
jgi:hypothetical protein